MQRNWETFPFQLEPKAAPSLDVKRKVISESRVFECAFELLRLLEEKNLVLVLKFIEFERSVGTYRLYHLVAVCCTKTVFLGQLSCIVTDAKR